MGNQAVAFQQLVVVLVDLRGDTGVLNAGAGRKQAELIGLVRQVIADVTRHVCLVVQFLDAGVRLACLCHIHACRRLHVGKQMLAFIRRYIVIHIAQFSLYHS